MQVENLAEAHTHLESHEVRIAELERRINQADKWIDTYLATPAWKRWWFMLDGWSGHALQQQRSPRPWHPHHPRPGHKA